MAFKRVIMVVTLLGLQYNVGEKPTVIILYTFYIINRHAGAPNKTKTMLYIIKQGRNINTIIVSSNHTAIGASINSLEHNERYDIPGNH